MQKRDKEDEVQREAGTGKKIKCQMCEKALNNEKVVVASLE